MHAADANSDARTTTRSIDNTFISPTDKDRSALKH
jgi:hypothetical protein